MTVHLPGIPQNSSLTTEDAGNDLVAIDDVIVGSAIPLPEPRCAVLIAVGITVLGFLLSLSDTFQVRVNSRCWPSGDFSHQTAVTITSVPDR